MQQRIDHPSPSHLTLGNVIIAKNELLMLSLLDSPVIQTILTAWTKDEKNLNYFNAWCSHILTGKERKKERKLI